MSVQVFGNVEVRFVEAWDIATCLVCGARETWTALDRVALGRGGVIDSVNKFIAAHKHPASKPLTRRQREAVRIQGIHRRGAWRLM